MTSLNKTKWRLRITTHIFQVAGLAALLHVDLWAMIGVFLFMLGHLADRTLKRLEDYIQSLEDTGKLIKAAMGARE